MEDESVGEGIRCQNYNCGGVLEKMFDDGEIHIGFVIHVKGFILIRL